MEAALWPYGKCESCANKNYCAWSQSEIANCMNNGYPNYSQMRNADKLRSMSDEELAEFLTTEDMCELICAPAPPHCDGQCKQKMLDWLRQEAQP